MLVLGLPLCSLWIHWRKTALAWIIPSLTPVTQLTTCIRWNQISKNSHSTFTFPSVVLINPQSYLFRVGLISWMWHMCWATLCLSLRIYKTGIVIGSMSYKIWVIVLRMMPFEVYSKYYESISCHYYLSFLLLCWVLGISVKQETII